MTKEDKILKIVALIFLILTIIALGIWFSNTSKNVVRPNPTLELKTTNVINGNSKNI